MTAASAREHLAFTVMGGLVAVALALIVPRPDAQELLADGYVYLLMADALRLGAAADPSASFLFGHYPFPPLFPALLAVVGAGADALERVFTVNAALLGLGCTLSACWLRSLGLAPGPVLALALVCALLPVTYATAIDVQSEPLYLVLTLASLVCVGSSRSSPRWHLAALTAGLAILARTAGLALLVAFSVVWLLRGRRGGVKPLLLAWAPFVLWQATRRLLELDHAYLKFSPYPPGELLPSLLRQTTINLPAMLESLPRCLDFANSRHVVLATAVLGVLAAVTFVRRLWRLEYDALYVAGYLVLLLAWPHPHHMRRFMFVVLPLLAGYALLTLHGVLQPLRAAWSRHLHYVLPAILLVLALPSLAQIARDLGGGAPPIAHATVRSPVRYAGVSPAQVSRQRAALAPVVRILQRARTELPADACISSAIPELTMFHTRRRTRSLALTGNAPRLLLEACPYVLMVAFRSFPDNGVPPMFPYHEFRSELQILDVAQSAPVHGRPVIRALLAVHRGPPKS